MGRDNPISACRTPEQSALRDASALAHSGTGRTAAARHRDNVDVVVMIVCGVLVVAGLAAAVAWGSRPFSPPPERDAPSGGEVARRVAWYVAILYLAGVGAGLTVGGPGGRLAMRLLAATAGDAAQGRITEAEEVVGRITTDGTIGFVVFNGIFGGLFAAALYLIVRRYLPAGRVGALLFGLAGIVVIGATVDPLRRDNPDFDLVGPGWLAVLVFSLLLVSFALTLAALAARLSTWLPLPARNGAVLRRYLLPAALALLVYPVTILLIGVGAVVVLITRWSAVTTAVRSAGAVLAGRVIAGALLAVALPNAIQSLADIATR